MVWAQTPIVDNFPEKSFKEVLTTNDCVVPCSYKMIQEIINSSEEIATYKGYKVGLMAFTGKVKSITFGQSPKGNPQLVVIVQDACGFGAIEARLTQYENNNLMEDLIRKNKISKTDDLLEQYVEIIITLKKINKSKWYFEARSLLLLSDSNQLINYFTRCIHYHCSKVFGSLK